MPDVALWNKCNNHCVMCTNPFSFQLEDSLPYSSDNIKQRWGNVKIKKNDTIAFTGGEPTIHPDFLNLVIWFREKHPFNKISIASNGRRFFYKNFTKQLLKINNLLIEIAIHGYDSKTHDAVTRATGSFEQTINGLHNILKYKNSSQDVEIRIIITKLTYKHLDKIIEFLIKEFPIEEIRDIALIFMEFEGQAKDNINAVGISYRQVNKYLTKLMNKPFIGELNELRLYHFPLCVLPKSLWSFAWRTLRGEEVIFLPQCKNCIVKKYCLGIHRDYISYKGVKEFKPFTKKIKIKSNKSFYKPIDYSFY